MDIRDTACREELDAARITIAEVLTEITGERVNPWLETKTLDIFIARLITARRRGETNLEYFRRAATTRPKARSSGTGEVVQPFVVDLMHRPAYVPTRSANPRADAVDAMPTQISMGGVGNGREDQSRFVRGK